jgi:hypothetical protein
MLLFKSENVQIADGSVAAIAKGFKVNAKVIKLLLDRRGDFKITVEVVKAAAGNS